MIHTPRRLLLQRANWDNYKSQIEQALQQLPNNETRRKDANYIENKLSSWSNIINKSKDDNIPMTTFKTMPYPKMSDSLKLIKARYDMLRLRTTTTGFTLASLNELKNLQTELTQEEARCYKKNWETLIKAIKIDPQNPAKFWKDIKRLMGKTTQAVPYVMDNNNVKKYSDEDKEAAFRAVWESMFSITQVENIHFDQEKE